MAISRADPSCFFTAIMSEKPDLVTRFSPIFYRLVTFQNTFLKRKVLEDSELKVGYSMWILLNLFLIMTTSFMRHLPMLSSLSLQKTPATPHYGMCFITTTHYHCTPRMTTNGSPLLRTFCGLGCSIFLTIHNKTFYLLETSVTLILCLKHL